jgi:thiol-disulfide isomerase/thioredoxin
MRLRVFMIVCFAILGAACGEETDDESVLGLEDSSYPLATDFTLTDLNGNSLRLSELRGKPVFLNFWATWCGPCVAEMPAMGQLHKEMGEQVHFVGVNLEEAKGTIQDFLIGKGYGWIFLMDLDRSVGNAYEISAIPTTFVLDDYGRVRNKHVGSMNYASMRELVRVHAGL